MSEKQKKWFAEWESKKRQEMGDSAFLDKYITVYTNRDKQNKVGLVVATAVMLALFIYRLVVLLGNLTYNNLLFAVVCFVLFFSWVLLTAMYFNYASDSMCMDHVRRWTKEREGKHKKRKTLKYTKCFKVFEEELTWDLFIKYLNENMEFCFYWNNKTIDIAFHYENKTKVYELNISSGENITNLTFNSADELVSCKAFNNKSLCDIWDELEN